MSNMIYAHVPGFGVIQPKERYIPVERVFACDPGLEPCGDRVLVFPLPTETMTKGGLVLPEVTIEKNEIRQIKAQVVAIGPDCWLDRPSQQAYAKVDDIVYIAQHAGAPFTGRDGRKYRFINDLEIIARYLPETGKAGGQDNGD
jgi:chaperonin GroES